MNEIICGNIGTVYHGSDDEEAQERFDEYVSQSQTGYGRAGGEDVIWFQNDEIYKEFTGSISNDLKDSGNPLD